MENIEIMKLDELPGIVVFYHPEMMAEAGLDDKILPPHNAGVLSVFTMPAILHNLLLPLLIAQKGKQYEDWIPVTFLIGQLPDGKVMPVLRLVSNPSEVNRDPIEKERQLLTEYMDRYIKAYLDEPKMTEHQEESEDTEEELYYMYLFQNFSNMLSACMIAPFVQCEQREIWKYRDTYYVIFDGKIKTAQQIASILEEYGGMENPSDMIEEHIKEHGECISTDILKIQKAFS